LGQDKNSLICEEIEVKNK